MVSDISIPTATSSSFLDFAELGKEVSVDQIERELKQLWVHDGADARASLMNFAIYSEDRDTLSHNSTLLSTITLEHACRALLICNLQSCSLEESPVRAWITAHCQLRDGKKSVCSEQLSFLLQCDGNRHVRNIVFSHLDSDLPLVFWWQGELNDNFEDRLFSVIDRLIIDSADWEDPLDGFRRLKAAYEDDSSRFAANDLAWSRTHKMRRALSDCFENASYAAELNSLKEIRLVYGPKGKIPALMLAAWVAQQLGLDSDQGKGFVDSKGAPVSLKLEQQPSSSTVGSLLLTTENGSFELRRDMGVPFIKTIAHLGDQTSEDLIPAERDKRSAHISAQLERAGNNSLYFPMVSVLEGMLKAGL